MQKQYLLICVAGTPILELKRADGLAQVDVGEVSPHAGLFALHKGKLFHVESAGTVPARPAAPGHMGTGECLIVCQILRQRDVRVVRKRTIIFQLTGIQIFVEGVQLMLTAAQGKINDVGLFEDGDIAEFHPKWLAVTAFGGEATNTLVDIQLKRPGGQNGDVRPEHTARFQLGAQAIEKSGQPAWDIGHQRKMTHAEGSSSATHFCSYCNV